MKSTSDSKLSYESGSEIISIIESYRNSPVKPKNFKIKSCLKFFSILDRKYLSNIEYSFESILSHKPNKNIDVSNNKNNLSIIYQSSMKSNNKSYETTNTNNIDVETIYENHKKDCITNLVRNYFRYQARRTTQAFYSWKVYNNLYPHVMSQKCYELVMIKKYSAFKGSVALIYSFLKHREKFDKSNAFNTLKNFNMINKYDYDTSIDKITKEVESKFSQKISGFKTNYVTKLSKVNKLHFVSKSFTKKLLNYFSKWRSFVNDSNSTQVSTTKNIFRNLLILKCGKLTNIVQKHNTKYQFYCKIYYFKKWIHIVHKSNNEFEKLQQNEDVIKINIQSSLMEYTFKLIESMRDSK